MLLFNKKETLYQRKQFAENISGALEKSVLFMSDEDFELIKQN